jgi:pSer/pThr/pTyr-binding forkhead associated (FHA) protein
MEDRDRIGLPADFIPLRLVLKASGTTVDLTRPDMILGRHSSADVRLPLPDVSRRHCRFFFEEGAWHVEDLKSLNGTFVNEQAIEQALVCHGDTLRIGGFVFSVDLGGEKKRPNGELILSITRALPGAGAPRQAS